MRRSPPPPPRCLLRVRYITWELPYSQTGAALTINAIVVCRPRSPGKDAIPLAC
jgi:hypothetical protein